MWSFLDSLPIDYQEESFGVRPCIASTSQRLVVEKKCKTLAIEPFPGKDDKEIVLRKNHEDIYRLNISRSYTAFYKINKDEQRFLIQEIATIEQANKINGRILRRHPSRVQVLR